MGIQWPLAGAAISEARLRTQISSGRQLINVMQKLGGKHNISNIDKSSQVTRLAGQAASAI
jgi:hypothetical protein